MIVHPDQSHGKSDGDDGPIVPSDPRVGAFVRFVNAVDGANSRAGLQAARELRRLGFSVCLCSPPGGGVYR